MGQEEVIDIFEKERRPLTSRELAKFLDEDVKHIVDIVKKLINSKELSFKVLSPKESLLMHGSRKPIRIYFQVGVNNKLTPKKTYLKKRRQ